MVQDYLDGDYISVNGTLYAIKVNSFQRFILFLNMIKDDKLVYENWSVLSKRFEDAALIHGLAKEQDEELKGCYKKYICLIKCYYETTLRARFKDGLVMATEKDGYGRNPQDGVGSSGQNAVKENIQGELRNVQKVQGNMVDDRSGKEDTSKEDDYIIIT